MKKAFLLGNEYATDTIAIMAAEPMDVHVKQEVHVPFHSPGSLRRLIITAHGIRAHGGWQVRLEKLIRKHDPETIFKFRHLNYGFFSVLQYIIPPLRFLKVRWCTTKLEKLIIGKGWDRIDIVAHSFGTHLIGHSLRRLAKKKSFKIHTVILAGSVQRYNFPWDELIDGSGDGTGDEKVHRVVNECGRDDVVLLINQLFVFLTGAAGRFGFSGSLSDKFCNRYYPFGHSGYFKATPGSTMTNQDAFMSENWLPLLLRDEELSIPEMPKERPFRDAVDWVFRNLEPIKLALLITPLLIFLLYILHQKNVAVEGTRIAMSATAEANKQTKHAKEKEDETRNALEREKLALTQETAALESAQKATKEKQGLIERTSQALHSQADVLLEERRPGEALAYLARALNLYPGNDAVAAHARSILLYGDGRAISVPEKLWDLEGGKIAELQVLKEGTLLVSRATSDGFDLDWEDGRQLSVQGEGELGAVATSGNLIATWTESDDIIVMKVNGNKVEKVGQFSHPFAHPDQSRSRSVVFSNDGRYLAGYIDAHRLDSGVCLWKIDGVPRVIAKFPTEPSAKATENDDIGRERFGFSPDSQTLVVCKRDAFYLQSVRAAKPTRVSMARGSGRNSIGGYAFSPDGRHIIVVCGSRFPSGNADSDISLFDVSDPRKPLFTSRLRGTGVWVDFSPAGNVFLCLTIHTLARPEPCNVTAWDFHERKPTLRFAQTVKTAVTSVRFSPDGQLLILACLDGSVKIADAGSGQLIATPVEQPGEISDVQISSISGKLFTIDMLQVARWNNKGFPSGASQIQALRPSETTAEEAIEAEDGGSRNFYCRSENSVVRLLSGDGEHRQFASVPLVSSYYNRDRECTSSAPRISVTRESWHGPELWEGGVARLRDRHHLADWLEVVGGWRFSDSTGLSKLPVRERLNALSLSHREGDFGDLLRTDRKWWRTFGIDAPSTPKATQSMHSSVMIARARFSDSSYHAFRAFLFAPTDPVSLAWLARFCEAPEAALLRSRALTLLTRLFSSSGEVSDSVRLRVALDLAWELARELIEGNKDQRQRQPNIIEARTALSAALKLDPDNKEAAQLAEYLK